MQERPTNRIAYATLIDHEPDPASPEILLELGMEKPVDWEAVGDDGLVICGKLDFRLAIGDVEILFVLDRLHRDFGVHGAAHVYVLALRPAPDAKGRPAHAIALETAVREARLRGRPWCADVEEMRIAWRHAPERVAVVENASHVPDRASADVPRADEEEIARLCDAFDAFCDGISDDAIMPLDELDLEFLREPPPIPTEAFAPT